MIIDGDTGELMNQNVQLALIEYVHEFCNNKTEISNNKSLVRNTNTKTEKNNEFDYCMYNMCTFLENKNQRRLRHRKILDLSLIDELKNNLIEISTNKKNNTSFLNNNFYLLYFCSNFTTSNENVFNRIGQFLNSTQEKLNCFIKIIIVSSDHSNEDYQALIEKVCLKLLNYSIFALIYESKTIKEIIFKQMNIIGIPWFSLINASNGEILSENLRQLILNSHLKGIEI